jgi:hypothetical protein
MAWQTDQTKTHETTVETGRRSEEAKAEANITVAVDVRVYWHVRLHELHSRRVHRIVSSEDDLQRRSEELWRSSSPTHPQRELLSSIQRFWSVKQQRPGVKLVAGWSSEARETATGRRNAKPLGVLCLQAPRSDWGEHIDREERSQW